MSKWVDRNDRMPLGRCIAWTPDETEEMSYRIVPKGLLRSLNTATHWMDMPEPPELCSICGRADNCYEAYGELFCRRCWEVSNA